MLGSNNIGDHVLSLKFEPNQQKICNLQQFSSNSHENSSMLGSNKIGDHVLSLILSKNNRKFASWLNFLTILPRIYKKINMLSSIKLEITDVSTNFEPQAAKKQQFPRIFCRFSWEFQNNYECLAH